MQQARSLVCTLILIISFYSFSNGQTDPSSVKAIQSELQRSKVDGWLFYDFRKSDPLAYRILKLDEKGITTRRWFYYIPASGEPVKIVHSIERDKLNSLPGRRIIYRRWQELRAALSEVLGSSARDSKKGSASGQRTTIAMQYSPNNDIPYISRVDAGTIELVRAAGTVDITTSADLVQQFEAVWTEKQRETHLQAANRIRRIIMESFAQIAERIRADQPVTEYDIQQFMVRRFEEEYLTSDDDPPIVAVNANAANPHYQPSREVNSPIRRGDFVLFDVWAKLITPGAVYADQTWTGYVGETVPEEYVKIFEIVREARDAAINFVRDAVRQGKETRAAQVDDVARGIVERTGYGDNFTHRTGHSIGEEVHGNGANIDNLETRDSRRIIPGIAFSIEPGIYLEGKFGVRSEINVVVGEKDIQVTAQPIQTEVVPILGMANREW